MILLTAIVVVILLVASFALFGNQLGTIFQLRSLTSQVTKPGSLPLATLPDLAVLSSELQNLFDSHQLGDKTIPERRQATQDALDLLFPEL
ncbi:MAG: hypothetical protein U1C97_02800 [Candidatus Gracilibacteria bacterium]|nr:hypothetical protein [Candidatus Gracilibacteria bacterium]